VKAETRSKNEIKQQKLLTNVKANAKDIQFPTNTTNTNNPELKQLTLHDFLKKTEQNAPSTSRSADSLMTTTHHLPTPQNKTTGLNDKTIAPKTSCNTSHKPSTSRNICKNLQCRFCPHFNYEDKIISKVTGEQFPAKSNISCLSSNIVYCIFCNLCGMQYVGETERPVGERLREHLLNIKHCKSMELGEKVPPPSPHMLWDYISPNQITQGSQI
jgi:hypothetical protein